MGQYHKVYNIDRKEFIHPHRINCGLKLVEQMGFRGSTADALFLLVANSNGRAVVMSRIMIWLVDGRVIVLLFKEITQSK